MKNIKNKSIISIVSALLMPLGLVVSCSGSTGNSTGNKQSNKKEKTFDFPNMSQAKSIDFKKIDLKFFKEEAIKNGITKDQIDSLTIDDVHRYRIKADKSLDKKKLIGKIDKLLRRLCFENNTNNPPEVLTAINDWINNASLPAFSSQRVFRGPWRSNDIHGVQEHYRHDLLTLRYAENKLDYVGSNFKKDSGYKKDRFIHSISTTSKPHKGDRQFDPNIVIGNGVSSNSFSIFRTRSTGEYDYNVDPKTGVKNWISEQKEVTKLFGGLDIKVNQESPKNRTFESVEELFSKMPTDSLVSFHNSKTSVNYGVARNKKAIDSGVKFNAKDLFYGLMRSLYASKHFRKRGIIDESFNLNKFIRKFNKDQNTKWNNLFKNEQAANALHNSNMYLFDLYGIDLEETIRLNLNYEEEDKFVVKFNNFRKTSLRFFVDSNFISPVPKSVIKDPLIDSKGKKYFDADTLSVFDYGNPYKGVGKMNPEGIYLLSPFICTEFSLSEREFQRTIQNPAYFDKEWLGDETSIKGIIVENKVEGIDDSAFSQARLKAFQDAKITGEYILDGSVKDKKTLLDKVRKYIVYKKPWRNGPSKATALSWNFYGFDDPAYNDLGKKMMWGFNVNDDIKNNEESMQNFFSGNGAKTRAAIKAAVNWYSMAQTLFPGQNKQFYPGIAWDNDYKVSNIDVSKAKPDYLSTVEDMKNIYEANLKDKYKAWTPSTVQEAAKTLDELADIVGATKENPAQIGVFRYMWLKSKASEQVIESNKMILKRLNTLTPKVKFVNFKQYSWSDFYQNANIKQINPIVYGGFGPDYKGLGTVLHQYLTEFGTFGVVSLFKDAFDQN